jgi:hypothetical protein
MTIDTKTAAKFAKKYAKAWLTRYPWPEQCVHDNGGDFVGPEFQLLLQNCGIKDVTTTSQKSNSKCNLQTDKSNSG